MTTLDDSLLSRDEFRVVSAGRAKWSGVIATRAAASSSVFLLRNLSANRFGIHADVIACEAIQLTVTSPAGKNIALFQSKVSQGPL